MRGLSRDVVGIIQTKLGDYARADVRNRIRRAIKPYVEALQKEGIGKDELEEIVSNNISFWQSIMPQEWKKHIKEHLLEAIRKHPDAVKSFFDNVTTAQYLFVEAVTDLAPWFPEVVTRDRYWWLENEIEEIYKNIRE